MGWPGDGELPPADPVPLCVGCFFERDGCFGIHEAEACYAVVDACHQEYIANLNPQID